MKFFETLVKIVEMFGYGGVFAVTTLEYACFPISSEILLPFLGYTASRGNLNLLLVVLITTMAGVMGSMLCYTVGRLGGVFLEQTLCKRFKTLYIGMQRAKNLFAKYGAKSVLIARVCPIARTYISFPAGLAAMPVPLFLTYTAVGALVWNTFLLSLGYFFGVGC